MGTPRFSNGQQVYFVGGEGVIKSYHTEAGTWAYHIMMNMGQEPNFGRIGHETTIVLIETELEPIRTSV